MKKPKPDLEPKQPRGDSYGGAWYFSSKRAALVAWRIDWIKWARREIKRLRKTA